METKTQMVVEYMRTHDGITQLDSYKLCYATRLGAIIFDLKERGYDIETVYHPMERGGRYAEYSLSKDYKGYLDYVDLWYKEHQEGSPVCYGEWLDNEGSK